jgi:hypothetical protein
MPSPADTDLPVWSSDLAEHLTTEPPSKALYLGIFLDDPRF